MGKEKLNIATKICMKDNFVKDSSMDTEFIITKMAICMREVSNTIKNTIPMGNLLSRKQKLSMKEVLLMENTTDWENFLKAMSNFMRASFFKE